MEVKAKYTSLSSIITNAILWLAMSLLTSYSVLDTNVVSGTRSVHFFAFLSWMNTRFIVKQLDYSLSTSGRDSWLIKAMSLSVW